MERDFVAAVDRHNYYRNQHGADSLIWDDGLARDAADYARKGIFGHDHDLLRQLRQGENLALGHTSATAAVDSFYNERAYYDYNNPGFSSATGHFTAVVWRATQRLGIAKGNIRGSPFYVFRYSPAGNMSGAFSANVRPQSGGPSGAPKLPPPRPPPSAASGTGGRLFVRAWWTHSGPTEDDDQGRYAVYLQPVQVPSAIVSASVDYDHVTFIPSVLGMALTGEGIWLTSRPSWGTIPVRITFTLDNGSSHLVSLDCTQVPQNQHVEYVF